MLRGATKWMERLLWAAGFLLLGYCAMSWLDTRYQQFEGNKELARLLNHSQVTAPKPSFVYKPSHGELIGKITIHRLGLSAVVFEGTDAGVLHRGVGHLTGSALPGQPGNVVLAGHRDSFFRSLRDIRKGDVVDVTTPFGTRSYQVESTEVVSPSAVSVEAPTPVPSLTLITCYPFNYIGNAPKRFIIRGEDEQELAMRNKAPAPAAAPVESKPSNSPVAEARPPDEPHYVSYAVYADSSTDADLR